MLRKILRAALRRPFVTLLVLVVAALVLNFGRVQLTQPDSPSQAATTTAPAYTFDTAGPGAAAPAYDFDESVAGTEAK